MGGGESGFGFGRGIGIFIHHEGHEGHEDGLLPGKRGVRLSLLSLLRREGTITRLFSVVPMGLKNFVVIKSRQ